MKKDPIALTLLRRWMRAVFLPISSMPPYEAMQAIRLLVCLYPKTVEEELEEYREGMKDVNLVDVPVRVPEKEDP